MLSVDEAFRKFKSRLELNDREQANASARQTEVRDFLATKFSVERSFLTGSYKRHTKTKPLKDIDIFFQLGESERHYRDKGADVVVTAFYDALVEKYGSAAVRKQTRSVNVDFGIVVDSDDNTDYRVLSVDVVPAFADNDDYEIPDRDKGKWIRTNPETHAAKATAAHQAYSSEWKGLVRMVKYWNNHAGEGEKPVKPSFLIEVMALQCLYGGWGGRFDYEIQALFETLADRVHDTWPDPAGLGPAVSDCMDAAQQDRARRLLKEAAAQATAAIDHVRHGRNGEALKTWRQLFGPKFPLS
jgi:hypothetical protein